MSDAFVIPLNESFARLKHAPIVEAVMELRIAPVPWEEASVLEKLKPLLPDYSTISPQREFFQVLQAPPTNAEGKIVNANATSVTFKGWRFQSADKFHVAQFNRDGFVFSRLEPYAEWQQFYAESMRLWSMYVNIAQPTEVQLTGLRFINRMKFRTRWSQLREFLRAAPTSPSGIDIPFTGFLHQDTFQIPDYHYQIATTRTPQEMSTDAIVVLLDISVFSTKPFQIAQSVLEQKLQKCDG